jgi:hypothetical protein
MLEYAYYIREFVKAQPKKTNRQQRKSSKVQGEVIKPRNQRKKVATNKTIKGELNGKGRITRT